MLASLFLLALPLVSAAPAPAWANTDPAIGALFKRQAPAPSASDPNFASHYPPMGAVPPVAGLPQAWLDKLKSVEIANVPVSKPVAGVEANQVEYPAGTDLASPGVCAYTTGCIRSDDIVSGPDGTFMITFDDGPGAGTSMLVDFLDQNQLSSHATHFMIGGSIVNNVTGFNLVFDKNGHIASHTWSHGRMTTLTNEEIVGELGWTMQVISDLTGGRITGFWRPPYGDLDERVRDVAKKVFGLECVVWNADTNDWRIAAEGKAPVQAVFDKWAAGPKSPGLNSLMHEIHIPTVEVFIEKYPVLVNGGWKIQSVSEALGKNMYINAADNKSPVTAMSINDLSGGVSSGNSSSSSGDGVSAGAGTGSGSSTGSAGASSTTAAKPGNSATRTTVSGVLIAAVLFAVAF